jgi:hypothetical protein
MSKQSSQPDHRDLYLLVFGLAVGLLLSQWCLGRFSPDFYEKWFVGGQTLRLERNAEELDLRKKIKNRDAELTVQRKTIESLKSESALEAFQIATRKELSDMAAQAYRKLEHYKIEMQFAKEDRQKYHQRMLTGLVMVIVVMMIFQTLMDPSSPSSQNMQRRFNSVRYAVMAGWLAMFMAQPDPLSGDKIPVSFFILLLVVAIGAALAPLGRDRSKTDAGPSADALAPSDTSSGTSTEPSAGAEQSESSKPSDSSVSPASDQVDQAQAD